MVLGPLDKVEVSEEELKESEKPSFTKDGGITVTSIEGSEFLKTKINEILGGDTEQLAKSGDKLADIVDWAVGRGATSLEDVLWEVRDLANRLGTPGYGESRLNFIYQWIYLTNESNKIKSKLKKMEGFNALEK